MTTYERDGRPLTELKLVTRVPEKWLAVDRETGDVWAWVDERWRRADVDVLLVEPVKPSEEGTPGGDYPVT